MTAYEAVIGIECHVQIRTVSKMFCKCPNTHGEEPNTVICPICMGYPGTLPVPNREAIRKTVIAGLMCGCEIALHSKFDRKSYFYPDLVKDYQITQYDQPLCRNGKIHIHGTGFSGQPLPDKYIGMTRIHLEEDPGKSNHFGNCTGMDYNRSGIPLIEIVSEPDMRSADEAYAYLTALKSIMQYAGVSGCDMEKGQMRFDVNISMRERGAEKFGTKVEIKNLNSFRSATRAISYEMKRQILALENGEEITQDTRGWNDESGETYVMRTKENANDYRYFPEPDLLPIVFTQAEIDEFRKNLPEHPDDLRVRFVEQYSLTPYDASVLISDPAYARWFEASAKNSTQPKTLANWFISELLRMLGESGETLETCKITPEDFRAFGELVGKGVINSKAGKAVFEEMYRTGGKPDAIVKEKGLAQVSDESAILAFVDKVIESSPAQVQQFRGGKESVLQYFVGQLMKLSRGKANPQMAAKLFRERLK